MNTIEKLQRVAQMDIPESALNLISEIIAELNAIEDRWIPVEEKDKWPPIDKDVLLYYTIGENQYFTIGYIRSITEHSGGRFAEWLDSDYNTLTPTHHQPLPTPPKG